MRDPATLHLDDLAAPPPAFVLAGARVPAVLAPGTGEIANAEGLIRLDLTLQDGRLAHIGPAGTGDAALPRLDLGGRVVLPGLVEAHTHLDKAFLWPRRPNPDGSFKGAQAAVAADQPGWSRDDLARRMEFALRCAHAHGTVAMRTHLDWTPQARAVVWPLFAELRARWAGRIALQACALVPVEDVLDPATLRAITATLTEHGGVLGAFLYPTPALRPGLEALFRAADRHGLALDFHADERLDPSADALDMVARTALDLGFSGRVLVGHCCALSQQAPETVARTLDRVARAGLSIVTLPLCNLYLQDRAAGRTPRQRGVTLLHEIRARGIALAAASDNVRDPFYAYGDLDLVEVWRETVRIAHLDHPFGDWPALVAADAAQAIGLEGPGRLRPGATADLIVLRARSLNEVVARPQADRTVLRAGRAIDANPPDYADLEADATLPAVGGGTWEG